MTILSPDQIDVIERMGVVCVAVESLFETARSAAESEKRYTDLRDAVLALCDEHDASCSDPNCRDLVHAFRAVVARAERGES